MLVFKYRISPFYPESLLEEGTVALDAALCDDDDATIDDDDATIDDGDASDDSQA